ncbi:MAG: hypothetical protein ACLUE8_03980 [Lachnospiraceae bacterium]
MDGPLDETRQTLRQNGWQAEESDPLRLTLRAPAGQTGTGLARLLRSAGMECEYADGEHLVLMLTPQNRPEELRRLVEALGRNERPPKSPENLPLPKARQEMSIREAMLRPQEARACGKIAGAYLRFPNGGLSAGDPHCRIRRENRPGGCDAASPLRRGKRGGREGVKTRGIPLAKPAAL